LGLPQERVRGPICRAHVARRHQLADGRVVLQRPGEPVAVAGGESRCPLRPVPIRQSQWGHGHRLRLRGPVRALAGRETHPHPDPHPETDANPDTRADGPTGDRRAGTGDRRQRRHRRYDRVEVGLGPQHRDRLEDPRRARPRLDPLRSRQAGGTDGRDVVLRHGGRRHVLRRRRLERQLGLDDGRLVRSHTGPGVAGAAPGRRRPLRALHLQQPRWGALPRGAR